VTAPQPGAAVPLDEGAAVPLEGAAVPLEGAAVPLEGAAVPLEGAAVPLEGAVPREGAAVPLEGDGARPHVTFVIPAYNEEARLPASLDRAIVFLGEQPYDSEIIVSDDGSEDATPRLVQERAAASLPERVTLRLIQAERNEGKGAAIRRGCLNARGAFVFFLDADLATPPEESAKLLLALEASADVVAGSRIQPDSSDMRASQPLQRRLAGRLFTLMRKSAGVLRDIDDTQCPMKGFRREAAQAIFREQRLSGWIFDAEVLQIARSLGYRIVCVPVRWRHVDGSRLRLRPAQAFEVARDLLRLRRMKVGGK
jgi:dolichyl-phosphate beta-glucosyltransferase